MSASRTRNGGGKTAMGGSISEYRILCSKDIVLTRCSTRRWLDGSATNPRISRRCQHKRPGRPYHSSQRRRCRPHRHRLLQYFRERPRSHSPDRSRTRTQTSQYQKSVRETRGRDLASGAPHLRHAARAKGGSQARRKECRRQRGMRGCEVTERWENGSCGRMVRFVRCSS